MAALVAAVGYGIFLLASALRLPDGAVLDCVFPVYVASELLITAGLFFGRRLRD